MFKNIYYDNYKNEIHLWEIENGKHQYHKIKHDVEYYVEDKTRQSKTTDIYGTPVIKKVAESFKSLQELRKATKLYESDVSEEIKFLQKRYGNSEERIDPSLYNVAIIDIEIASGHRHALNHVIKIRKDDVREISIREFEKLNTDEYEVFDEETRKWTAYNKSCYYPTTEFPKPELAKYPINLITINFVNKGKIVTFGSDPYTGNSDIVKNYIHDADETQLLQKFIQFWKKSKIDIAVAYNAPFDFGYILKRCENLGIDPNDLSPVGRVEYKNPKRIKIHGITILDYIDLYKKFAFSPQPSYKLENVAMAEIGEGKTKYEGDIFSIWKTDWNLFVEYNIQDTVLVEKMDKKRKLIPLAIKMATESLVPVDRCMTTTLIVEGYILKYLHKQNKVMVDRNRSSFSDDEDDDDELEGAHVEAYPGFYKFLLSFDVESLYPHMIMMYNISPETKLSEDDIVGMDESEYIKTPIPGVYYKKNVKGILPMIVEMIFQERKKFKKLMNESFDLGNEEDHEYFDSMQHNRKILINSMYGVMGAEAFHFFDIDNASVVTAGGRELIKHLSENVNNYLNNWLPSRISNFYSEVPQITIKRPKHPKAVVIDTDSNYIDISDYYTQIAPSQDFIEFSNDFDQRILTPFFNKLVDIYCNKYNIPNKINFKREKIILKMFVQVKKKYVCQIVANEKEVYDHPKIKITGLETKKSDLPGFCKTGLNELIDVMFAGDLPNEDAMVEVVRKYQKIHKESPVETIAIPKGVKDYKKYSIDFQKGLKFLPSTPIHNRASINYNYMVQKYKLPFRDIDDGAKIKYLFVNENNELHQNVIAFDDEWPELFNEKFKIDRDELFVKTFLDISQRMFDALGFKKISLKQNKMGNFLKKDK